MFDAPEPLTDTGIIDLPRLVKAPGAGAVHLVYLLNEGSSQRIMYTRIENGEFRPATYLSQQEGLKMGGGFLAAPSANKLVTYWINVAATSGQLRFKASDDGGRTFTIEGRWNERSEARWPCVLELGRDTVAFFFVRNRDDWELVANRDRTNEREPTLDVSQGTPFHLQGISDQFQRAWLAYFVRRQNADGGRIAFLTSEDGGNSFERRYLFDDQMIAGWSGFFSLSHSFHGNDSILHLIFAEESPELTTIYYSRSEDDGVHFTTPVAMISSEEQLTASPLLVANRQYVVIATADAEEDGPALRYMFSEDGGKSFDALAIATRNVTSPGTIAGLIDDNGGLLMVWDDISSAPGGTEQLFRLDGILRGQ